MRSIRWKIMLIISTLVVVSLVGVAFVVATVVYNNSIETAKTNLSETAKLTATYVNEKLSSYEMLLNEISLLTRLSSADYTNEQKGEIMEGKGKLYNFFSAGYIDTNGMGYPSKISFNLRDYFTNAMAGKTTFTTPYLCEVHNIMELAISAPVMKEGKVDGVVYFIVDATFLSDIVSNMTFGKTGSVYMLDAEGDTIAHKNFDLVKNKENTIEQAKTNKSLQALANLEAEMIKGGRGVGSYKYNGKEKFLAYMPVGNDSGWSIAVTIDYDEVIESTSQAFLITIAFSILFLIIGIGVSIYLAYSITLPVKQIEKVAEDLSNGQLGTRIDYTSNNELGRLAESMRKSMEMLTANITDIDMAMSYIAEGDYDLPEPRNPFVGEFKVMENNVRKIIKQMSNTFARINAVANQVKTGADQVASGANVLAQGTTEQAGAVTQLSASINEVSEQVKSNAQNSIKATEMATDAVEAIEISNEHMSRLVESMKEIDRRSNEINKIIKTIEDIAFQTNILALNASVEASHAGAAGKGFSVVAQEVRNLSLKSTEAAKNTSELIEGTVKAVKEGAKLAGITSEDLDRVVRDVKQTNEAIALITNATNEQSVAISQISVGLEQISNVIQLNSSTSEESAAASEQLSNQATALKSLISKFKLKEELIDIDSHSIDSEYDNISYLN